MTFKHKILMLIRACFVLGLLGLAAGFMAGPVAQAEFIGSGQDHSMALLLTVSDGDDTVSEAFVDLGLPDPPGHANGRFKGHVPPGLEFRKGGKLLGRIDEMEVELDGDPLINLSFTATAGSKNTTFTISSATVSFPPGLFNVTGHARADLTLTDNPPDGASIVPVAPNTGMFRALYNGGTLFGERLGAINFSAAGGTVGPVVDDPGPASITGVVTSIQAEWKFTLSAHETASGHGSFEVAGSPVVPEPTTAVLLGVALATLLACGWRRWRRK